MAAAQNSPFAALVVQPPGLWALQSLFSLPQIPQTVPSQAREAPTASVAPAAASFALDPKIVQAAIDSLYTDRLKPYGRILRKRIAERAQVNGVATVDVDIKRLRTLCESCHWLRVQTEDGGDWSVLIKGRDSRFVDVYSPVDIYPAELWTAAAAYFETLPENSMQLPGGRYSCAYELMSRNLAFLKGRSLGEVAHIIQLAISQKKLLGYLSGAVVPYARSQSMVKERCAERGRPCTSAARGTTAVASWDLVRACLREIMGTATNGPIPLSNIKRLFRSRFHLELSETSLGHAKLSELLQDERLKDICAVRLQGHGYVVAPVAGSHISLAEALCEDDDEPVELSEDPTESDKSDTAENAVDPDLSVGCSIRHTFIHLPKTDDDAAQRRSRSLPKDFGSRRDAAAELEALFASPAPLGARGRLCRDRTQSCTIAYPQATEAEQQADDEALDQLRDMYQGATGTGTSEMISSIKSVECPWGPTPEVSFAMSDAEATVVCDGQEGRWPQLAALAPSAPGRAPEMPGLGAARLPRTRSLDRAFAKHSSTSRYRHAA